MTIKELAAQVGITDKAVYKRIKSAGLNLSTLKDKGKAGHLTAEGERILLDLFSLPMDAAPHEDTKVDSAPSTEPMQSDDAVESEVEDGGTSVENKLNDCSELKAKVEKLKAEVEKLEAINKQLIDERDNLRGLLDREQQLHLAALSKIPSMVALPPASEKGFISWLRGIFKPKTQDTGAQG